MPADPAPISWCLVEGDPVLLDVATDRYLRLSGSPAKALLALADGGEPPEADGLAALRARIAITPDGIGAPCRHTLPSRALVDPAGGSAAPLLIVPTVIRLIWTRRSLKRRGLAGLIERFITAGPPGTRRPRSDITTLVRAHAWTRRIIFSRDACLVRAFALAGQARSRGFSVSIVFGVQLRPFAAHCWVEQDGVLLDDELDHVRCFHPILVL